MPSAGDRPGWLPDPKRAGMLRWWNGLDWSDAYRAPDAVTEAARRAQAEAHRISTMTPQQVQQAAEQAERTIVQRVSAARQAVNTTGQRVPSARAPRTPTVATPTRSGRTAGSLGGVAIVLAVLGLVIGFSGLPSLLALVVSVAALVRSRQLAAEGTKPTGLVPSLIGLVLSVLGVLVQLPTLVLLLQGLASQSQQ